MVIQPVHEIGKYGGNLRRPFTGPADHENGNRINSSDRLLTFDYTGTKIVPMLAKGYEVSGDSKTVILFLRKGAKWSDGTPFTADDFMFWYNDIYMNKEIVPVPFFEFQVNGKPGTMRKIDDFTVAFDFPDPYPYFLYQLAGDTAVGSGLATRGAFQNWGGCYAPAHYLKQFLPKYSSTDAANAKAKAEGYDSWISLLRMKYSWALNPELPVMTAWKTVSPINTPTWSMERNPYFWQVDTAGNQLPYIDRVTMTLAENAEVANLRAIAGEFDIMERHMHLAKLPVFLENQAKGNYTVHLDPGSSGSDMALHIGTAYNGDPEIAKWLKTKKFRNALSIGIDRAQLNEAYWLGLGTPGSTAPSPDTLYSPGPEYNKMWAQSDVNEANKILDELGLNRKDSDGFRLRSDGRGRLRLEITSVGGQFVEYTKISEMIVQQWRRIGIDATVNELERNLAFTRDNNNENQIITWSNSGSEMLLLFPRHALPVDAAESHMGMAYARWYASNGATGTKPEEPEMLRAMDLMRKAFATSGDEQVNLSKEIWKIIVDQQWSIGIVGQSPAWLGVRIAKNNLGNVPARQMNAQHLRTPFSSQPVTFYFK
jgi:peptide/nickel transport system substrate-binding protein